MKVMEEKTAIKIKDLPPLSLYVHLPWCIKKCPYCDFNSHQLSGGLLPEREYMMALMSDLASSFKFVKERKIESIFFGGGTPSLFSGGSIKEIIDEISLRAPVNENAEISLELNPGVSELSKLRDFRDAGVNRLSIGVQSFSDSHLRRLGRIHSGQDAVNAIDQSQHIFSDINVDIMYGLPQQSLDDL